MHPPRFVVRDSLLVRPTPLCDSAAPAGRKRAGERRCEKIQWGRAFLPPAAAGAEILRRLARNVRARRPHSPAVAGARILSRTTPQHRWAPERFLAPHRRMARARILSR